MLSNFEVSDLHKGNNSGFSMINSRMYQVSHAKESRFWYHIFVCKSLLSWEFRGMLPALVSKFIDFG